MYAHVVVALALALALALASSALATPYAALSSIQEFARVRRGSGIVARQSSSNPLIDLDNLISVNCQTTCSYFVTAISTCATYSGAEEVECGCSTVTVDYIEACAACITEDPTTSGATSDEAVNDYNSWVDECASEGYGTITGTETVGGGSGSSSAGSSSASFTSAFTSAVSTSQFSAVSSVSSHAPSAGSSSAASLGSLSAPSIVSKQAPQTISSTAGAGAATQSRSGAAGALGVQGAVVAVAAAFVAAALF